MISFHLFVSVASASSNDPNLYCQTGLEDRPPPPSLHQHYNSYYHLAQNSSPRTELDPRDEMGVKRDMNPEHHGRQVNQQPSQASVILD